MSRNILVSSVSVCPFVTYVYSIGTSIGLHNILIHIHLLLHPPFYFFHAKHYGEIPTTSN